MASKESKLRHFGLCKVNLKPKLEDLERAILMWIDLPDCGLGKAPIEVGENDETKYQLVTTSQGLDNRNILGKALLLFGTKDKLITNKTRRSRAPLS